MENSVRSSDNLSGKLVRGVSGQILRSLADLYWICCVSGTENISRRQTPALIAATHKDWHDHPRISSVVHRNCEQTNVSFIAGQTADKGSPILRWWQEKHDVVFLNGDLESTIRESRAMLSKGNYVCIYPEGKHSIDQVGAFRTGAGVLSYELQAEVIPIAQMRRFENTQVCMSVLPAISPPTSLAEIRPWTRSLRERICDEISRLDHYSHEKTSLH